MNLPWLFFAAALLAGTLITVQIGSNARLKEAFGEALPAVIISSSLGIVLLFAVTLTGRIPWPSLPSVAGTPWWGWLGGPLGALLTAGRYNARRTSRRTTSVTAP